MNERIAQLVARFDGLIKYTPMIKDNPDWSDDQCITFAKEQHMRALKQRVADANNWNVGIPYCRNVWRADKAKGKA